MVDQTGALGHFADMTDQGRPWCLHTGHNEIKFTVKTYGLSRDAIRFLLGQEGSLCGQAK